MNLFEIPPSWSEKRKKLYLKRNKNPNSYYFRYKDPNEEIRNGPFTQKEKEAFIQRLKEVGPSNWGIFSRTMEGRVGYQCSNYYKYLVSRGEIEEIRNFKKKKVVNGQKKPRLRWIGKNDKQNDRTFHDECTINGDSYRVHDIILLRSSNDMPRMARIESMYSKKPGRKLFKCRWFYRFEDLQIDDDKVEQNEFDDRELFLSSIYSIRNLEDVIRRGYVYQKSDFLKLTAKDIEKLELDSECECVFYSDKYFNGQINFQDDCSEEDEEIELLKPEEMKTESLINYPINFDPKQEQHIFTKKELQQESPPSTNKKTSATKKNVTKDTIYCCIEGCKNICWTKRLASNLKNHWDLKEGGKYICGTHYNKDKKQKMNNTGNSNGSNNNNPTKNAPIKKRKLPDKDDLSIINQNNVIIHTTGHNGNGISSHSLFKNPNNGNGHNNNNNGNHPILHHQGYNSNNNNNNFPYNNIQSNLHKNLNNNLHHKNFISNTNNINHNNNNNNNNTNLNIHSNILSSIKKIKRNPVSQVRGVVVYKDRIEKENAIGEVIIFPTTTIEEMKETICLELKQDLPFELKRCHIPIPESQYQKLAYLFFNDRVEDSLVIVPSFKKDGALFTSPSAGRDFLGLLSVVNQIN